ncbi:MAG: hypothetical protein Q9211_004016 [Gyalolechia sp. 1 TL-2023]
MRHSTIVLHLLAAVAAHAQSLLDATAPYPQLSDFNELLSRFPDVAANLLTNISTGPEQQTILVPSNEAFDTYRQQNNANISSLSSSEVGNILSYHTLPGALSSSDIQQPDGLISNTALTNSTYANREVPANGGRLSQVVFISTTSNTVGAKIKARQIDALSSTDVKSGEGNQVTLEQTPGNWSGGLFYVVDGFLTLPVSQTDTMTAQNLTSFVLGLDRTNVTQGTNAAKGLTCVCPNNEAFAAMDDLANTNGNVTDGPASLLATITRHGLTGSYYTTNFTDGDLIQSQNGYPILVRRRNGAIFLNDAQIVGTNFIANTGCVHALDRIMGFLNTTTNITTPANDSIYSDTSNIPSPTPVETAATSSASGSATSHATGTQLLPESSTAPAASATSPTAEVTGGTEPTAASSPGTSSVAAVLLEWQTGIFVLGAAFLTGFYVL